MRGDADYLASHDLEDIITVVAGRPELLQEVRREGESVQRWLSDRAAAFLLEPASTYAIQGALPDAARIQGVIEDTRSRFEALVMT